MSDLVTLQILIDGVDMTDLVDLNASEPSIVSALNSELDTLDLTFYNASDAFLTNWKEIVIKDDGSEILFGGYHLSKDQKAGVQRAKNDFSVRASDYGAYLEKCFYTGEFVNQSDAEILAAVIAGADPSLSEFDASLYVAEVRTYTRVVFKSQSVKAIIEWLADNSGANWYVDYSKRVHFFGSEEYKAPFSVTDDLTDTDNALAENVMISNDATGVVNVVELIAGNALSANGTFPFTKTGIGTKLQLDQKFSPWDSASKIAVRRNDGGATTNLIVNPSFETNITDGWTQYQAGTGAVWTQDTSRYNVGSKSLKIVTGTAGAKVATAATINLAPGEGLSIQVMAFCATVGMASIALYDTSGLVDLIEQKNRKTNTWEKLAATYLNSTAASLTVRVELRNYGTDSALEAYFDAVQAEKSFWPTAYCDGSLGTGYAWSGTANNSSSTRVNMPVWTTLTVKIGNSDTLEGANEVLYYESAARLEQENNWPTLDNGIEIDGRTETPVHVIGKSYASYQFYGKWFKEILSDPSIVDPVVARIKCTTELAQYAMEATVISFDVRKKGLRAGMTLPITLTSHGISGEYMIKRVTTTIGVGGHIVSNVELGAVDKGLVGLLRSLALANNTIGNDINSDEVYNQLIDFVDSVGSGDAAATVSESGGPYQYGTAKFGYAKFGA